MLRKAGIAAFVASAIILAAAYSARAQTASADDTARFLAGMSPSSVSPLAPLTRDPAWQQHARYLNSAFGNLDKNQFAKIRAWSSAKLTAPSPVLFYMFSGPDFLYANAFFPNATTYVMAGLEPVGPIPDLMRLPRGSVAEGLRHIEGSLSTILTLSFFKTHDMRMTLGASRMNGALPLLYVFLARTGNAIQDVSLIKLDAQGIPQTAASGPSITSAPILPTTASRSAVLRNSAIGSALGTRSSRARPICSTAPTFPTSATSSSGTRPRSCKTTPAYRSAISHRINGSCVRSVGILVQSLCLRATISPT